MVTFRLLRVAAHWASWADALPMIKARSPAVCDQLLAALADRQPPRDSFAAELQGARATLVSEGFDACPTWAQLADGARPPEADEMGEPGEWRHGWQFFASNKREHYFRRTSVLSCQGAAACAHTRAHGFALCVAARALRGGTSPGHAPRTMRRTTRYARVRTRDLWGQGASVCCAM